MTPDSVTLGQHVYVLTLNLFLTGAIGLIFTIAAFYWQRKVKKEDAEKRKLIEARERADAERHDAVIESVKNLRGELSFKSDNLFRKIDDFCKESASDRGKMKRNFWKHYHSEDQKIIIPEYEP